MTKAERETPGLRVLAALIREPHGRTVAQLEKRPDDAERMRQRTATASGRALYKLLQQTAEPVFGIIKEILGFRRFSLRGHQKVSVEWDLVCLAYNVKRLHRLGAAPRGPHGSLQTEKPVAPKCGGHLPAQYRAWCRLERSPSVQNTSAHLENVSSLLSLRLPFCLQ